MSYVKQKTWQAVDSLISADRIQVRLAYAMQHLLVLRTHFHNERPSEMSRAVNDIVERLAAAVVHDGSRSWVDMEDGPATKIAEEILSLFVEASGGLS